MRWRHARSGASLLATLGLVGILVGVGVLTGQPRGTPVFRATAATFPPARQIHWPNVVRISVPANVNAGTLDRYSYRVSGQIPSGAVLEVTASNLEGSSERSHQVGELIPATRQGSGSFRLSTSLWSIRVLMLQGGPHTKGWGHERAYSNGIKVYSWSDVKLSVMCDANHTTNGWNEVTGTLCQPGTVSVNGRPFHYEMYDPVVPAGGLYRPLIEQLNTTCTTAYLKVAVVASGTAAPSPVQVMMVYSPWQANPNTVTRMKFRLPRWSFDLLDSSNAGGSAAYYTGEFRCFTKYGELP